MQEQYLLQMNELNQELNDENGKLPASQDEIDSLETKGVETKIRNGACCCGQESERAEKTS